MKKFYTSIVSLSLVVFCSANLSAQQIVKKGNGSNDFAKKSAQELAKSHGYDRCSFVEYENQLKKQFPNRETTEEFEAWLAPYVEKAKQERLAGKSQSGGVITIPVVVHVIHSGEPYGVGANITDEQVMSQITVMNQDYRKMAGTPGWNTNAVGVDTMIQFALAKVDLNGNPTNGIDRVNLCQPSWSTTDIDLTVKPSTTWDATQYMNMWSVNFSDGTLLGYAQFPSSSGLGGLNANGGAANTDGVVANWSTFGSTAFGPFNMNAPYDKGRTMTHEVGHFLGLRHIWGDSSSCVVNATDSNNDYCLDTPAAAAPNFSCPQPPVPPIDSCPSSPGNDMVENYMDYTNDICMSIFTQNQKDRFTAVMNASPRRSTLKTSIKDVAIPLFANDAEVKIERNCTPVATCSGSVPVLVSLYNRGNSTLTSAGFSYTINGTPYTYTWNGSLAQDKYAIVELPGVLATLTNVPVSVNITTANGVTDQRVSNNTATGTYSSTSTPVPGTASTSVVFRLQQDYWGSETRWQLKNSAGTVLYSGGPYTDVPNPNLSTPLPALITQNWTLNNNDCYTFTILDAFGDGMYNYGGYYDIKDPSGVLINEGVAFGTIQNRSFKVGTLGVNDITVPKVGIYPNPVGDIINITNVSNKSKFKIYSAAGQLVMDGVVSEKKVDVSSLVKGVYVISINDDNKEVLNTKIIKK